MRSLIMVVSSCFSSPQPVNLCIYLIRFSVHKTGQCVGGLRKRHHIQNIQYIIPDSCIPVPESPIADSSPILGGSQIQCRLIERLFLPALIVGISLRHRPDVPIIAVAHMDSVLLLNQFKRVKPHCTIRLPFHQPATVPIDLKSIGPLYDRCKVSR